MTRRDRHRLVVLKEVQKKLITQSQAAQELDVSDRHVRRLLVRLRETGDESVIHGLRGWEPNRKLSTEVREKAVRILSGELYWGPGPMLAREYLAKKHKLAIGRETLRQLMKQRVCGAAGSRRSKPYTNGGRGAVYGARCSNGTPPSTTGWKAVASACI